MLLCQVRSRSLRNGIARSTPVLAISTMAQIQYVHRDLLDEFQRELMRV